MELTNLKRYSLANNNYNDKGVIVGCEDYNTCAAQVQLVEDDDGKWIKLKDVIKELNRD
ncbi:MAG: hypothetical protein KAJ19_00475 [Gammaproteobacteria bacterium]|nr:hypothetical protein [Gammaproteobacteria bacterium]